MVAQLGMFDRTVSEWPRTARQSICIAARDADNGFDDSLVPVGAFA